jgi:uncharacterized RDD family membrane protein YckC
MPNTNTSDDRIIEQPEQRSAPSGDDRLQERPTAQVFSTGRPQDSAVDVVNPPLAPRLYRVGAALCDGLVALVCALPGLGCLLAAGAPGGPLVMVASFLTLGSAVPVLGLLSARDVMNWLHAMVDLEMVSREMERVGIALFLFCLLALAIYQIYLLASRGQTIGKRLMGVRIVNATDNGNPGFVRAVLLRLWVPYFIGGIFIIGGCFFWADIVSLAFWKDRRSLRDRIAATKVVRVAPRR